MTQAKINFQKGLGTKDTMDGLLIILKMAWQERTDP